MARLLSSPRTDPPPTSVTSPRRWLFLVLALIGVAFAVMPVGLGMFAKSSKGAAMMDQFRPFMTAPTLDRYQADMQLVSAAVTETDGPVAKRLGGNSALPSEYTEFAGQWPAIDSTMTVLLDHVQGNLGNYQAVMDLPSFRVFPWMFAAPGLLLAAAGLVGWRARRRPVRVAAATVLAGAGLALAVLPFAFGMFSRAPAGGRMMSAFKTIETPSELTRIQGYFSSMATGQGVIRLDVVPRLESSGLNPGQVAGDYPAVTALDNRWVSILSDMTPMIGAMSDGVPAYQAVRSMPPFGLFPWFFLLPGIGILTLGAFSYPRPDRSPYPGADK